jgi:sec-independent protein translocase protein TatB
MLNFSPEKLFLVALIAMIVLGPSRLPHAARTLGRFMAEMRRMSSSFQDEVRDAIGEPTEAFHSAVAEFRPALNVRSSVRDAISTTFAPPSTTNDSLPPAAPQAIPGMPPPAPPATPGPLATPDDPALN